MLWRLWQEAGSCCICKFCGNLKWILRKTQVLVYFFLHLNTKYPAQNICFTYAHWSAEISIIKILQKLLPLVLQQIGFVEQCSIKLTVLATMQKSAGEMKTSWSYVLAGKQPVVSLRQGRKRSSLYTHQIILRFLLVQAQSQNETHSTSIHTNGNKSTNSCEALELLLKNG